MKTKILGLLIGLFIFSGASAQKKIKGVSSYFPGNDSIEVTKNDLNYLLKNSIVICSKVDTLDDGAMLKTVEIACTDTTFKFVGAYMESNLVQASELRSYVMEGKQMTLKCAFVLVDEGELYETFELDDIGKKQFEGLLNRAKLKCIDTYKGTLIECCIMIDYFYGKIREYCLRIFSVGKKKQIQYCSF